MRVTYVRRFRMELDLVSCRPAAPALPPEYVWIPWSSACLDRHAFVKYESFRTEVDSRVFPCLGTLAGCQRLMYEIAEQDSFLPGATWLISHRPSGCVGVQPSGCTPQVEAGTPTFSRDAWCDCGTIQGMAASANIGSIQNVGIHPEHRGLGLGRALVLRALAGFRGARLRRVYLEVTAQNARAVSLYRSIGFRVTRTLYKPLRPEPAPSLW